MRAQRRSEVERGLVTTLERLILQEPRFVDLTLARLVTEAGLSRTTFYKYFDSKIDVLSFWLRATVELLAHVPQTWSGSAPPTRDELVSSLHTIAAVYRPRLPLIAAVYETSAHDSELRAQLAAAREDAERRLHRHIVRGQREGWINRVLAAEETARWLMCMGENGLRHIVGPAADSDVATPIDAWADSIRFTLYTPARSA